MSNVNDIKRRTTGGVIVALALCLSAAFFLLGLPMTVFAMHPFTLQLAYCGVAATFLASIYFAVTGARSATAGILCAIGIVAVASIAIYVYHFVWLTN